MAEIKFKATRRKHSSGYREIDKSGDLQYDFDPNSSDGIWIHLKDGSRTRVMIDCDHKTGVFSLKFDGDKFEVNPWQV